MDEARVLVIAAHPDDAELGLGGTIAGLCARGIRVAILDLTDGEPTPHGSPEIRERESAAASLKLGVTLRKTLPLPNRALVDTVEARAMVANVIRELRPELLCIPYWEDAHPDHLAAERLASAARFYAKFVRSSLQHAPHYPRRVLHYWAVHMRVRALPSIIVDVSEWFERKMAAVRCYRSQFEHAANAHVFELLEREGAYWGEQIGARYGEPLFARDHLGLRAPDQLLELR